MTMRMKAPGILKGASLFVGLFGLGACGELLVDGRTLEIGSRGTVEGIVYLDIDGNATFGGQDVSLPGARIQLLTAAGDAIVDTVTTGPQGLFAFPAAEVGAYRLGFDPATLADSFVVIDLNDAPFLLERGRTFPAVLGLGFPTYPPLDVRSLPTGVRLFTRGVVLNVRATPGDGVVHIREGNAYLRITQVPPMGLSVGDSVRVQGRTARSAGQPVLEAIPNAPSIINLGPSDQLIFPVLLSTLNAAQASGGTLDAALVRIENAAILAAALDSNGQHLVVTADDGTGPVELVLRNFLNFNLGAINPGTTQFSFAVGLLVPVQDGLGTVRWQLTPRGQGDLNVSPIGGG